MAATGVVLAGAAIAKAGASIYGSMSGAKAAEKAAEDNARFTFSARMEEIRRRQRDIAQTEGTAIATGYSAGVQKSGSTKRYIDSLRAEHTRQISFANAMAHQERKQILQGGKTQGLGVSILGQAASGISGAVSGYKSVS
jgi:hypothetical protein